MGLVGPKSETAEAKLMKFFIVLWATCDYGAQLRRFGLMRFLRSSWVCRLAASAVPIAMVFACSSSGEPASRPQAGTGGTGAAGGTGGTGVTGGTSSTGGSGGLINASDIEIVGSVTQCPGTTPQLPAGQIPSCTSQTCLAAHCVPANQVPAGTDTSLLATCSGGFCTPDDYIATYGKFLTKVCQSVDGAEGRCISTCIPQVEDRLTQLPQRDCAPSERCAPCFDPIDGRDTRACNQGCDAGPTQPPYTFTSCGSGEGLCVPKELVPTELQAAVPPDTCTQTDHVCAPIEKVKDLNYNFPVCVPTSAAALLAQPGPNGQTGGCVPIYLVPADKRSLILQDTCQTGELCAPCTDPLANMAPTGACPLH